MPEGTWPVNGHHGPIHQKRGKRIVRVIPNTDLGGARWPLGHGEFACGKCLVGGEPMV